MATAEVSANNSPSIQAPTAAGWTGATRAQDRRGRGTSASLGHRQQEGRTIANLLYCGMSLVRLSYVLDSWTVSPSSAGAGTSVPWRR